MIKETFTITKRQMIKAVATENLKPEAFFHDDDTNGDVDTCPVCAVGAIIRQMGAARVLHEDVYHIVSTATVSSDHIGEEMLEDFIDNGRDFLSRLSCEFEYAYAKSVKSKKLSNAMCIEFARTHAINYIEAFAPKQITINVYDNENAFDYNRYEVGVLEE